MQGVWASLLALYSNHSDVVFGCVISGRPAQLPGVESAIGPFINTLPLRVNLSAEKNSIACLMDIQKQFSASLDFGYSPLAEIQRWSEVPKGKRLFESLFVFENFPVDQVANQESGGQVDLRTALYLWRQQFPPQFVSL